MNQNKKAIKQGLSDFKQEKDWIDKFSRTFEDRSYNHPRYGSIKYLGEIEKTIKNEFEFVEIHFEDLENHFVGDEYKQFLSNIKKNGLRYVNLFTEAAEDLDIITIKDLTIKEQIEQDLFSEQMIAFDTELKDLAEHKDKKRENASNNISRKIFKNKFRAIIVPGPNEKKKIQNLRDLKAENIGSMVRIKGTVVRVTEVKPKMTLAVYLCTVCKNEIFKTVHSKEFMPPNICESDSCKHSKSRGNIVQQFASSKFVSYQEMKIQEMTDQAPIGSVPRSFSVQMTGSVVRICSPGDVVLIDGLFLPKIQEGYNLRDPLVHETYIEALNITKEKKNTNEIGSLDEELVEQFKKLANSGDVQSILVRSLAPEIFGLEFVKKSLLLQMVGGSTISHDDGLRIRGDLNIALIGDPGVAKSQLLKHIARLTPRGIYTTGKGSSGAGLTASIMRDPLTNEISLEGGALVLADLGICCIDEFDKMQDNDRVAIHEVMEQQTISLAKAGITTSLNARASILAAANPVYGRYERNRSPHENIGMPYSLLSRFDLVYILLDKNTEIEDLEISRHIAKLHRKETAKIEVKDGLSTEFLQSYILYARSIRPRLPEEVHQHIINRYVEMRRLNKDKGKFGQYVTPRTLLGIIRFALASAKLRLDDAVTQFDVDLVLELMDKADVTALTEDEEKKRRFNGKLNQTEDDKMKNILKDIFKGTNEIWVNLTQLAKSFLYKGYNKDQMMAYLKNQEDLQIYQIVEAENKLYKVTM